MEASEIIKGGTRCSLAICQFSIFIRFNSTACPLEHQMMPLTICHVRFSRNFMLCVCYIELSIPQWIRAIMQENTIAGSIGSCELFVYHIIPCTSNCCLGAFYPKG